MPMPAVAKRVDLKKSAVLVGDIYTPRVSVIQSVAEELLRKKTLNAAEVRVVVLRCDEEQDSS